MDERDYLQELYELIATNIDLAELKTLCFDLGVVFDELPGDSLVNKAKAFVLSVEIRGMLEQLITYCHELRPHVKWPELLFPVSSLESPGSGLAIGQGAVAVIGQGNTVVGMRGVYVDGTVHGIITSGDDPERIISQYTNLRLDTALPSQVQQGRTFELAVSVRQPDSPTLKEDDLDKTKSGDVKVNWPEDIEAIDLRVHVQAPECAIHGEDSHAFQLLRGQDSPVFYFQLTPQQGGRIGIIVTVFQEKNWLGGTRLHTQVQEQVAGKVAMQIYSQSVGNGISHQAQVNVAREIETLFDLSELRTLCQDLDVLYGNLPGETQAEKARGLVSYMVRRGRVLELLQICQELRPHVDWFALADLKVTAGSNHEDNQ